MPLSVELSLSSFVYNLCLTSAVDFSNRQSSDSIEDPRQLFSDSTFKPEFSMSVNDAY